jgi:hypothetical protein
MVGEVLAKYLCCMAGEVRDDSCFVYPAQREKFGVALMLS